MDNYIPIYIQPHHEENASNPAVDNTIDHTVDDTQNEKTYFQSALQTGSMWAGWIGNGVGNAVNSIVSFGSYPKEHVKPHILPTSRSNICDYSGKSEESLYVQYMPYDRRYGIIYGSQHGKTARMDCYNFCKEHHIYPISMDFLSRNSLDGIFHAKSGGYKNWRIVRNSTTILKNEVVVIEMSDNDSTEFINLKTICSMNKLDYKEIMKLLEIELQEWYGLTSDFV